MADNEQIAVQMDSRCFFCDGTLRMHVTFSRSYLEARLEGGNPDSEAERRFELIGEHTCELAKHA